MHREGVWEDPLLGYAGGMAEHFEPSADVHREQVMTGLAEASTAYDELLLMLNAKTGNPQPAAAAAAADAASSYIELNSSSICHGVQTSTKHRRMSGRTGAGLQRQAHGSFHARISLLTLRYAAAAAAAGCRRAAT
jgi:hypothetical protein